MHQDSALNTLLFLIVMEAMFENTYFTFFSDFKKHDFLRFLEMTYQKVVKSRWAVSDSDISEEEQ